MHRAAGHQMLAQPHCPKVAADQTGHGCRTTNIGEAKMARAAIAVSHTGGAGCRFFVASCTSHAPISAALALPHMCWCQQVQQELPLLQVGFMHACRECWQQRTLRADTVSVADVVSLAVVVLAADAILHATHRAHAGVRKVRREVGEAWVPIGLTACMLYAVIMWMS
jgi:fumarate reductase subunit D